MVPLQQTHVLTHRVNLFTVVLENTMLAFLLNYILACIVFQRNTLTHIYTHTYVKRTHSCDYSIQLNFALALITIMFVPLSNCGNRIICFTVSRAKVAHEIETTWLFTITFSSVVFLNYY